MNSPTLSRFAVAACLLASLSACSDPAAKRDQHLKSGDQYLAQHKLAEASIEYRQAQQADPRSVEARRKLGEVYFLQGNGPQARGEFVRAADLAPDDVGLQLKAGGLLLIAGYFEDAKARAEIVLGKHPKNVTALILRGNAMGGLKDLDGAIKQIEALVRADPSVSAGYSSLGSLQMAKGNTAQAEEAFKRVIADNPNDVDAKLALAGLYWSTDRPQEAEKLIVDAVALAPRNELANRALALLYTASGQAAKAEAPLKVLAEESPTAAGRLALGDYYGTNARLAEARTAYETVAKGNDEGLATDAKIRLAGLDAGAGGDRAKAYRTLDEVIAKQPTNAMALRAKAQLQFEDGKTSEALTSALASVSASPNSPAAQFMLGRILASENQIDEAIAAQKAAVRANANYTPASMELARLLLLTGNAKEAEQYAKMSAASGNPDAQLLFVRALMANGGIDQAETQLKALATKYGASPSVQAEVGRLYMVRGNQPAARMAFERALGQYPAEPIALEGLTIIDIQQNKKPAAHARVDAVVAKAPTRAPILGLAGQLYVRLGDLAAAEQALKKAIAADPNYLDAYEVLARIYVEQNRLPEATAEFERAAERSPKSVGSHTAVAILLELQGKTEEARQRYEKVLIIDSHAAIAANNLAVIYASRTDKLDEALQLALSAKSGRPMDPNIDDTIGWIYYKKQMSTLAIESMKRAVAAQPENPVFLGHLGLAYALNSNKALARQTLDKALKIKSDFENSDEVKRVRQTLGG